MAIDKVREYLKQYNLDKDIIEFDSSSATVTLAAQCLNCSEGDIAKSLSFIVDDKPILIIVAGDKKIDNSKFKGEFHTKAKMINFEEVEELIGHAAGGVCPFAIKDGVVIYLDESLKEHDYVYPACGSSNSAIKISINKLEEIIKYKKWVDVCK